MDNQADDILDLGGSTTMSRIAPRSRRIATMSTCELARFARTVASEQHLHAAVELALAHTVGSAVEHAYMRCDLPEQRRTLMHEWASYPETDQVQSDARVPAPARAASHSAVRVRHLPHEGAQVEHDQGEQRDVHAARERRRDRAVEKGRLGPLHREWHFRADDVRYDILPLALHYSTYMPIGTVIVRRIWEIFLPKSFSTGRRSRKCRQHFPLRQQAGKNGCRGTASYRSNSRRCCQRSYYASP